MFCHFSHPHSWCQVVKHNMIFIMFETVTDRQTGDCVEPVRARARRVGSHFSPVSSFLWPEQRHLYFTFGLHPAIARPGRAHAQLEPVSYPEKKDTSNETQPNQTAICRPKFASFEEKFYCFYRVQSVITWTTMCNMKYKNKSDYFVGRNSR